MGKKLKRKSPHSIVLPIIGLALLFVLATYVFWQEGGGKSWFGLDIGKKVERLRPADFSDWRLPQLEEGEVILGRRELRMREEMRREVLNWDYSDENGQLCQKRIMQLYDYIETHRVKAFYTSVNPFLVCRLGGKPMISKEQYFDHGLPKVSLFTQRIGCPMPENPYGAQEIRAHWLAKSGLREVVAKDGHRSYERDGERISFRNIKIVTYHQIKPNTNSRNERAQWGSKHFAAKYVKSVNLLGDATLDTGYQSRAIHVPGDISFDPGVNEDHMHRPIKVARSSVPDCSMEVFVELRGNFILNGVQYEFGQDTPPVVARDYIFVKDYVPPLPEKQPAQRDKEKKSLYDFVIPQGRPHIGDKTGIAKATGLDPDTVPIPLNYWPNKDKVDRDGDGVDDYKWESIALRKTKAADSFYQTLHYEVGLALANRIKYKSPQSKRWRYMYYLPYRPVENEFVGPYAGRVRSSAAGMDGYDKYDLDNAEGHLYEAHYQPMILPEKVTYQGRKYRPRLFLDMVYKMADPAIEVAQKRQELAAMTGFRHVAGISVIWGRESAFFITLGNTRDPECRIRQGLMLIAPGFSSCINERRNRRPNFDAELLESVSKDSPKSLMGGLAHGAFASDCFYRVNARDAANNNAVLNSGHYAAEDNLRPIPSVTIRDNGKVIARMTIPNDLTGAGLPLGAYSPNLTNTRIHKGDLPLFNGRERASGLQGVDFRGYGNYCNNAACWSCLAPLGTMHNPKDAREKSFLIGNGERDLIGKEIEIIVEGKDNISPTVEGNKVLYPIQRLCSSLFGPYDRDEFPTDLFVKTKENEKAAQRVDIALQKRNLVPVKKVVIIRDTDFTKEPKGSFMLSVTRKGCYLIKVDVEDLSGNGRTMLALFQVR